MSAFAFILPLIFSALQLRAESKEVKSSDLHIIAANENQLNSGLTPAHSTELMLLALRPNV